MLKVPAIAPLLAGVLRATDIDTGTETLDIDWGWAANGTDTADEQVSATLASGPATATTTSPCRHLLVCWPKTFAAETDIQLDVNAAANAGGTGTIWMIIDYVM